MSQITTHVLDTARGKPAAGIPVLLERLEAGGAWRTVWHGTTDHDGRVRDVLEFDGAVLIPGVFRLHFETESYFKHINQTTFYPYVEIVFQIEDPKQHYHVPLLLSPFGYSTYRGS